MLDLLEKLNDRAVRYARALILWAVIIALCIFGVAVLNGMIPLDAPLSTPRQFDVHGESRISDMQPSCYGAAIDALPTAAERAEKQEACALAREELRIARGELTQAFRSTNAAEDGVRQAWQQTLIAFVQAILTVLALVFTGWAALAASSASRAAGNSVRHAENATKIQLRAYLHVEAVYVVWTTDLHPGFDVTCKNTGQTPARWFELAVDAVSRPSGTGAPATPTDLPFSRWPVVVGASGDRIARCFPADATKITLKSVKSQDQTLFVLGRLKYEDVFGDIHESDFTAFLRSPTSNKTKMSFSTAGNLVENPPAI